METQTVAGLCAICFESETQLEWRLLPCGHRFHPGCVDEWLKKEGASRSPTVHFV